jgi:hypothetical protein
MGEQILERATKPQENQARPACVDPFDRFTVLLFGQGRKGGE